MAKDLRSRKSGMGGTKPFAKKPEIDPRQEDFILLGSVSVRAVIRTICKKNCLSGSGRKSRQGSLIRPGWKALCKALAQCYRRNSEPKWKPWSGP